MKPTKASAEPAHHYTPEEMHNEDVAHEHVDVNITALVWSMVIMFGSSIGHGSPDVRAVLELARSPGRRQGSQALSAGDAVDGDAADDDGVAIFRRRPGAEADDRRAEAAQRGPDFRAVAAPRLRLDGREGWRRAYSDRRGQETDDRAGARGAAGSADRRAPRHTPAGEWRIVLGSQRHPHTGARGRVSTGAGAGRARSGAQDRFRVQGSGFKVQGSG